MNLDPSKFNLGVSGDVGAAQKQQPQGSNPFDDFSGMSAGAQGGSAGFQDPSSNMYGFNSQQPSNDFSDVFDLKKGNKDWLKNS